MAWETLRREVYTSMNKADKHPEFHHTVKKITRKAFG